MGSGLQRTDRNFWTVIFVVLFCVVPFFVTPVLPFTDLYAHSARYFILAEISQSPDFQLNYESAWQLLPNLGLDVIGTTLMTMVSPLVAASIVGFISAAAPFIGTLYLCYVLQGRLSPANVFLAGILVFNGILIWGFTNFLLGIGLGVFGIALWIHLQDRQGLQLLFSAILGIALLLTHGLAFAIWGLLLGTVELMLAAEKNDLRPFSLLRRMVRLALLAVIPVLLFLQMPTSQSAKGFSDSIINLLSYSAGGGLWNRVYDEVIQRFDTFLRVADSSWIWVDRAFGIVLWGGVVFGIVSGAFKIDRRLWLAVALTVLMLALVPPNMFGSGHLDDRMPLILLMLLAAGLSVVPGANYSRALILGLASLFIVRTLLVTVGWYQDGKSYSAFLQVLKDNDTGKLGTIVYFDDTRNHDTPRPNCAPLSFLLLLQNRTAIYTFDYPTQQPLRIKGPLSDALEKVTETPEIAGQLFQSQEVKKLFLDQAEQAGFDTIVTCDRTDPGPPPEGMKLIKSVHPWTLYGRG